MGVSPDRNAKSPGQAKVCQFDHTQNIDEQILGLEVSVEYPVGVAELNAFQDLVGVALDNEQQKKEKKKKKRKILSYFL